MRIYKIVVFTLCFSASSFCFSTTPELVKDITQIVSREHNDMCSEAVELDGTYYFCGESSLGQELWKTDGSANGTVMVADLVAGANFSGPRSLISVGDFVYFAIEKTIYRTDGTLDGTIVLKEFSQFLEPFFVSLGTEILFTGSDGNGEVLWKSDGSVIGTTKILNPLNNSEIRVRALSFFNQVVGSQLYFRSFDETFGDEVWTTDGTTENTHMVLDIAEGSDSSDASRFTKYGDNIVFYADDGSGNELWLSDGSSEGTFALTNIDSVNPFANCRIGFAVIETTIIFCADGAEGTGPELWVSEGLAENTKFLTDINGNGNSSLTSGLFNAEDRAYFIAEENGPFDDQLWVTDGTISNTVKVTSDSTAGRTLLPLMHRNGKFFYVDEDPINGVALWSVGKIGESPVLVSTFDGANGMVPLSGFKVLYGEDGNNVYFRPNTRNAQGISSIWKSDGTSQGTVPLASFAAADSFQQFDTTIEHFSSFNDLVLFSANDAILEDVHRVWVHNNTVTKPVSELKPASDLQTQSSEFEDMVEFDGMAYFLVGSGRELGFWKSDGTQNGTIEVTKICTSFCAADRSELVVAGNQMFFLLESGELWRSDGTAEGTFFLKEVGRIFTSSKARNLTPLQNSVIFVGHDDESGRELWKSDGTEAGTGLLNDILPGNESGFGEGNRDLSALTDFELLDNVLYFTANDGVNGPELWRTNGTQNGTFMVKNIFDFEDTGSFPQDITRVGDQLFFAAFSLNGGYELYKSDGTRRGTVLVKNLETSEIFPGFPRSSLPLGFIEYNGKVVFRAYNVETGYELWISDGSANGTMLLKDILPGAGSGFNMSRPSETGDFSINEGLLIRLREHVIYKNELYFVADTRRGGTELWKTDGTSAGTLSIKEIEIGDFSAPKISNLTQTISDQTSFVFQASDSNSRTQLWQSDGTTDGTKLVEQGSIRFLSAGQNNIHQINDQIFLQAFDLLKGNEVFTFKIDSDEDGVVDINDNCILQVNADQFNFDGDLLGDDCDLDDDNDGVPDVSDAFQFDASESNDNDDDGTGDNADPDDDNDLVNDFDISNEPLDNCPFMANPDQADANNNGVGDVCEIESLCFPLITKERKAMLICL